MKRLEIFVIVFLIVALVLVVVFTAYALNKRYSCNSGNCTIEKISRTSPGTGTTNKNHSNILKNIFRKMKKYDPSKNKHVEAI